PADRDAANQEKAEQQERQRHQDQDYEALQTLQEWTFFRPLIMRAALVESIEELIIGDEADARAERPFFLGLLRFERTVGNRVGDPEIVLDLGTLLDANMSKP